jgi:hypothetical protein
MLTVIGGIMSGLMFGIIGLSVVDDHVVNIAVIIAIMALAIVISWLSSLWHVTNYQVNNILYGMIIGGYSLSVIAVVPLAINISLYFTFEKYSGHIGIIGLCILMTLCLVFIFAKHRGLTSR